MSVKTEPAACSVRSPRQTASKTKFKNTPYNKTALLSSLRAEIGTLLLFLQFPVGQELSQVGWTLFERLLRRYIDCRVLPQGASEQPQAKNSERPD